MAKVKYRIREFKPTCLVESWTQPCTYPDCKVKDWATGKPYYMEHKKPKR